MKYLPNCKLNIGLRVVRKREDGYHDIDTVFYPVYGLYDELEVEQAESLSFEQEGIAVDCKAEDNLILRCYRLMASRYPQIGNVRIRFKKNIPFGAGLGGGSSDAAHMAIALNELFDLGLSKEQLAAEVRELGADCPFFIYNTPCHAQGIGEILTPIDFSLAGYRLVMLKPDVSVSTRKAYSGLVPSGVCLPALGEWKHYANDFETTVFALHPQLGIIKQRLLDLGAVYASMSGSGSTIFGLFENNAEGRTLADLGTLEKEFAPMILFNDTLRER